MSQNLFRFFVLVSLSIIMNVACLLKSWYFSWKCLHDNMVLEWGIFTSFLWLFSLILKKVSFPTYCFLHNVHSTKYMTYATVDYFLTMLFSIFLLPMSSLTFLLRLKPVTASFWKVVSGICQQIIYSIFFK